jgi:hypothetical protein
MAPAADSFAHRKASATLGGGDDPVTQSHFFTLSPSSTRRRMASERLGSSSCLSAHVSTAARRGGGNLNAVIGSFPVAGRPRLFLGITLFDFAINRYNLKASRGEAYTSAPALTRATTERIQMTQADSVHSTPPTNTSATTPKSSRRGFLVQAAGVAGGAAIGAGLPLPAPPTAAAQSPDAELIELGTRFEPLVDRYYVTHRRWSRSLARAHAEHDREFGDPADRNYEYPPEIVAAFRESCERSGAIEADETLSAIHEEMKQLANAINAASVTSIEGLRVKALVAFWQVAPLSAGASEFSFEDAYPFQQLFTAVAELCGLKDKMLATGYELPDIAMVDDDSDDDSDDEGKAVQS